MLDKYKINLQKLNISNETLEKLNKIAQMTIIDKRYNPYISYDYLEECMKMVLDKQKRLKEPKIKPVILFSENEMLQIAFQFWQSIDENLYENAKQIVFQNNDNVKMYIYNKHKVKNFKIIDEFGIQKFTKIGNVTSKNGKAIVHIPTRNGLSFSENNIIEKGNTLTDAYILIHEIAHTFDLDLKNTLPNKQKILETKRSVSREPLSKELLTESTARFFEMLFTDYLNENDIVSSEVANLKMIQNVNSSIWETKMVYMKLLLAKEFEKNGKITGGFLEKIERENNFSRRFMKNCIVDLLHDRYNMGYEKRYAIANLVAPTLVKRYKELDVNNRKIWLKNYLEAIKTEDGETLLKVLGIQMDKSGINVLIENLSEYIQSIKWQDNDKER